MVTEEEELGEERAVREVAPVEVDSVVVATVEAMAEVGTEAAETAVAVMVVEEMEAAAKEAEATEVAAKEAEREGAKVVVATRPVDGRSKRW